MNNGKTTESPIQQMPAQDTLLVVLEPEDAIWGHLGEGTGMSTMEFITDNGDTLLLLKESEDGMHSARIRGEIRNYTDRFCITTTDSGTVLKEAINITQMQEMWSEIRNEK